MKSEIIKRACAKFVFSHPRSFFFWAANLREAACCCVAAQKLAKWRVVFRTKGSFEKKFQYKKTACFWQAGIDRLSMGIALINPEIRTAEPPPEGQFFVCGQLMLHFNTEARMCLRIRQSQKKLLSMMLISFSALGLPMTRITSASSLVTTSAPCASARSSRNLFSE